MHVLTFLSLLLLGLAAAAAPAQPLRIGALDDAPSRAVLPLLQQAYARLGQAMQLEIMPLRRAAHLLERGEIDAELMRAGLYFERHPQALKVEPALMTMPVWAHRRPPCPPRVTLAALAQGRVVHERGVLAIEFLLPEAARVPVAWRGDVFAMLRRGRAEYSLSVAPYSALADLERGARGLCRVPEPVLSVELFHVLHARHRALRPELERALRALQAGGTAP